MQAKPAPVKQVVAPAPVGDLIDFMSNQPSALTIGFDGFNDFQDSNPMKSTDDYTDFV
jgi:hypothetical protein